MGLVNQLLSSDGFEIRVASTASENADVQEFMRLHASRTYRCAPPPSTGMVIGAWQGDNVVGSVALDFRGEDEPFPLEKLYPPEAFEQLFPEGFRRTRVAQVGRWFSALGGSPVSRLLICALALCARAQSRSLAIGEGKPYTLKRFAELGYTCTCAPNHKPILEAVPPEGRRYYELDPPPCLFSFNL